MDEKLAPLPVAEPGNARHTFRGWTRRAGHFILALCGFWFLFSSARQCHDGISTGSHKYNHESIKWNSCGEISGHKLECSSIDVPMDQFDITKSSDKTFNIPLIRLRGKQAKKNILFNPGGPGAGGTDFIRDFGESLNAVIGEGFHLVSFDPRGVGASQPLASCYPDEETRQKLSNVRVSDAIRDGPELYSWAGNFAKACNETTGEHLQYLNTPQTAADMNNILDALGQKDMFYWGLSYGTIIGQVYASMFPDRVGRMIIDGVADQKGWFEVLVDESVYTDTDKVLSGFFEECFAAGKACPLSQFAKSPEQLQEKTTDAINRLRSAPASVYINNTLWGDLTDHKVWFNGVYRELYQPENWPRLAHNLAQLLNGSAHDAFISYGRGDLFHPVGESFRIIGLNDALTGPDNWSQKRLDLVDKILPFFDKYFFSFAQHQLYYMKQQWNIPRTHKYITQEFVHTAHPLLLLSMKLDPVCPLSSAKVAQKIFKGSQLVTINGYGHCSLAMPSKCAESHVRKYLYHGTVPGNNTECGVDKEYFPA